MKDTKGGKLDAGCGTLGEESGASKALQDQTVGCYQQKPTFQSCPKISLSPLDLNVTYLENCF